MNLKSSVCRQLQVARSSRLGGRIPVGILLGNARTSPSQLTKFQLDRSALINSLLLVRRNSDSSTSQGISDVLSSALIAI